MGAYGGEASHESRKKVTALFADVVGSTALAETLDPEALRQVMMALFERMAKAIERHGGAVENFIGDEVAGVFGARITHGDDALRAVRAAADMLAEVAALDAEIGSQLGVELRLRIGVSTGTVVVGPPIAGRSMSLGDPMNVAARLQKLAEPGQILISEDSYRLVRSEVVAEGAGAADLRGRAKPIETYRLISAHPADHAEPEADLPIVGRDAEMSLLLIAFERAVARRSQEFITVLGEPGVGKSRLVAEVAERYRSRATVLVGRCLPYGEGITYWPLVEIISQAAAIDEDDDADLARSKLDAVLREDPDGPAIARHLAQIVGLDDSFDPGEQAFWSVRRLLQVLAKRRPLVIWIEDLQWAEPTLLDLILHVTRNAEDAPITFACTTRFELLDKRPDWRQSCPTTIQLDPLPRDAVGEMITTLVGDELDGPVGDRIVELAAGNPLFVEQVLSMLIEEGGLERTEDGWGPGPNAGQVPVPPSIEAILAARIDHLSDQERALANSGAVIGREFSLTAATAVAGEGGQDEIDGLVGKRLIEPVDRASAQGDTYMFRHILVRDAVYETLSKARRAQLHERFADWLAEWSESRLPQWEEIVGYHLEAAYRFRRELLGSNQHVEELAQRAAVHLSRAGQRAAARQDDGAAAALLTRSVTLMAESDGAADPTARLEPLVELGMALVRGGETERAELVLAEGRRAVAQTGDERSEARMRILEANLKRLIDPPWWMENGRAAAEGALGVFHRLDADLDAARAWHLLGKYHSDRGQQTAAADALQHGLELAQRAGDRGVEAWIRYWLLQAFTLGPNPCKQVIAQARGDLDWAVAHDNRALQGSTLGRMGEMLARSGQAGEAEAAFAKARGIFVELDQPVHVAYLALSTAPVEPLAGDPVAAEQELRAAADFFEAAGAKHITASLLPVLAMVLVAQGQTAGALDLSERTEAIAASEDLDAQVKWRLARAKALTQMNRLPKAERYAREAVDLAGPSDMVLLQGDALVGVGEVMLAARAPSEAVPLIERALAIYEAKGDVVSAKRLREGLDRLSDSPAVDVS